jgi:hypothetical protein
VYVVQASVYQIVHVVAMRYHFMAAVFGMVTATGYRLVFCGVFIAYRYGALVPMAVMLVVQVTVVYIIDMVAMLNFSVATSHAVLVVVVIVYMVFF